MVGSPDAVEVDRNERLWVLGSLVSGLAHEIRTPLAAATNHLSILQRRLAASPGGPAGGLEDAPGHLAATLDALDRIDALVERLRPFVTSDAGQPRAPHSLDEVAQEALDIFLVANPGRFATLGEMGGTPPVEVDRLLLQHALLRLAQSATDAEAGAGTLRISTRETPIAVELVLEAPLLREAPHADGGYRAAHRIIERQGGALTHRAEPPRGTTFVVSLPKRRAASATGLTEVPVT